MEVDEVGLRVEKAGSGLAGNHNRRSASLLF